MKNFPKKKTTSVVKCLITVEGGKKDYHFFGVPTFDLTDDLIYVNVDTSYVIGFNGMEVPTINPASYSNGDGEVNTMFAPVQSMEDDTVTVRMYFWNNEYEIIDEVFYIVLN